MSIVNNALAFPNCEAPGAAAPDVKVQDSTGSSGTGPGFAKELKDCVKDCENKIPPETQKPEPKGQEKSDAQTNDNGMPDDSSSNVAVYGIVGILEGFEPPGYQSDITACIGGEIPLSPQPITQSNGAAQATLMPQSSEAAQATLTPQSSEAAQTTLMPQSSEAVQASGNEIQANGENASGLPEQIARMLQNNEAGTKPVQTQDEILKIVGDYLDSLENTNSQTSGTVPGRQTAGIGANAEGSVQNVPAQAGPAGADNVESTKTAAVVPEAPAKPEGMPMPEKTVMPGATPQKPVVEAKPAADILKAAEAVPETAGAKAEDVKSQDTVKPDVKVAAGTVNGETANAADIAANKAQAEQPVQPAAETRPAVRESVLKIVDTVRTAASEGKYDFDIDLKPDFMGKVNIKLTMEDGSVKVQIKADDIAVKGMLSDQMSNLHFMLKEKGIPVTTINVLYGGETMSGREESAGQYERRNPQGSFTYEQTNDNSFDSAKESYDFYLGGSYVEYLA